MEDKIRELLECYHLEVKGLYRGRGAWLCETDQGLKLMRVYPGSPVHLQWERMVKECLRERGHIYIDQFLVNKKGSCITTDDEGDPYVLTDWYAGRECSTRDKEEILRAVAHMAGMHKSMHGISRENEIRSVFEKENVLDGMERRRREFKTIRNYIAHKKQKNTFDRKFMEVYPEFDAAGKHAQAILEDVGYQQMYEQACEEQRLCHGDYTQHNILVMGGEMALVRFDQMHFELQIYDLYVFMRKILEKNRWNVGLGLAMLSTYHRILPLNDGQIRCLYAMLVFPEKFWKIVNRYYNTRKSWMSAQNMSKLDKLIREREQRNIFLHAVEKWGKI